MEFYRWHNILLYVLIGVSEFPSNSVGEYLFLGKYPSPDKTNSPIAIQTDKVNQTFSPPLILRGVFSDKVKLTNNGKKLELTEVSKTISHVTGGVLGDDIYVFEKTNFLWTDEPNGVSATTIDGKGFRIEAVNYFYNKNYGSFENSLNHRDGLAVVVFPATICDIGLTSSLFTPFSKRLKEVLKAENSTMTELGTSFIWYDDILPISKHYTYPGAYKDEKTGHIYYCQTNIVFPHSLGACITEEQFAETFGSMKDSSGNRLTSTEKQFPRNQPVVESIGVLQIITITNIFWKRTISRKISNTKKTDSPININTTQVIEVNYPPLFIRAAKIGRAKVINTGKTVEVISSPFTKGHITGGVLGNAVYHFEKNKFIWTDDPNGIVGNTINGKGFPLKSIAYFFNIKYKTFENALNYRDGLATVVFPVKICSTPSATFPSFAKALKKVLKAGDSTTTNRFKSVEWYDLIPPDSTYFAFAGSYNDLNTGKKYYCATVIVPYYPGACISQDQFSETFGSMKNASGQPLTSSVQRFPRKVPVLQAKGIVQLLTTF